MITMHYCRQFFWSMHWLCNLLSVHCTALAMHWLWTHCSMITMHCCRQSFWSMHWLCNLLSVHCTALAMHWLWTHCSMITMHCIELAIDLWTMNTIHCQCIAFTDWNRETVHLPRILNALFVSGSQQCTAERKGNALTMYWYRASIRVNAFQCIADATETNSAFFWVWPRAKYDPKHQCIVDRY